MSDLDLEELHDGLPVPGYRPQGTLAINLVTDNKIAEERLLRTIDTLRGRTDVSPRWLAIAQTYLEMGFMALNRSVFQPERISLPDDMDNP